MTNKIFGDRIRDIRKYYQLNQIDFSAEIGVSQSEYSKIELGKVKPSKTVLYAMMARLAVNPDWVITGEGEMLLSAEEYFHNGIKLLGEQKISEGLKKLLNDPKFVEIHSLVAVGEMVKDKLNPNLEAYLQYILGKWHQGDETVRGWLMIQLGIAFREVAERLKEDLK
jgi:transcriptional regulator with XRE-family HTH domain